MTTFRLLSLCALLLVIFMIPVYSHDIIEKEKELSLMPSDTVKANVLISLGEYYCSRDFEKALLYLQEALVISTEHNYKKGIAGSYLYQGRSYYYKDQYGISFDYLGKARKLFEEIEDKEGLANYHFAAGANNTIIGNLINATENFQAMVILSAETGNKELQCLGYVSLGSLHIQRGEPLMAMSYLNEALGLARECDDSS